MDVLLGQFFPTTTNEHGVEKGEMKPIVDGEVKNVGSSLKRGYKTPDQICPDLAPTKAVQREELAKKIKGGTVLETCAGRGELSEHV